jgi:hypothetical protein
VRLELADAQLLMPRQERLEVQHTPATNILVKRYQVTRFNKVSTVFFMPPNFCQVNFGQRKMARVASGFDHIMQNASSPLT